MWIQSNGSLSREEQQYGPWLWANLDHLQKPQVVRVRSYDMSQDNRETATGVSIRRIAKVQGQNMVDMVETQRNHDPNIFRNNVLNDRYIPQNLEFPLIQKTLISTDFEA